MTASNPSAVTIAVRWARLSPRERAQALRALAWLAAIGVALRCCPYRVLRASVGHVPARRSRAEKITVVECGRAVRRASSVITHAGCLAKALAAACMLRRDGRGSTLIIGVGSDESRAFAAHAWLVADDTIVIGEETAAGRAVLLRDGIPAP